jgi:hypothetical protein
MESQLAGCRRIVEPGYGAKLVARVSGEFLPFMKNGGQPWSS